MSSLRNPASAVAALSRSPFRRKFKLSPADRDRLRQGGAAAWLVDARGIVASALAPAQPEDDGRQTPFRGHPVYVAQHGTATCCRRCLERWHHLPAGVPLSLAEQDYVVAVIAAWLAAQARPAAGGRAGTSAPATA